MTKDQVKEDKKVKEDEVNKEKSKKGKLSFKEVAKDVIEDLPNLMKFK